MSLCRSCTLMISSNFHDIIVVLQLDCSFKCEGRFKPTLRTIRERENKYRKSMTSSRVTHQVALEASASEELACWVVVRVAGQAAFPAVCQGVGLGAACVEARPWVRPGVGAAGTSSVVDQAGALEEVSDTCLFYDDNLYK